MGDDFFYGFYGEVLVITCHNQMVNKTGTLYWIQFKKNPKKSRIWIHMCKIASTLKLLDTVYQHVALRFELLEPALAHGQREQEIFAPQWSNILTNEVSAVLASWDLVEQ